MGSMSGITPHIRLRARELRLAMTPQERKLWGKLREVNRMLGTHFRRQAPVGRFIADFVDFGRKLVIEVDGGGHGGEADMAQDAWLRGEGFAVMRFWNSEVDGNLDGVMQGILDALEVEPPRRSGEGRFCT